MLALNFDWLLALEAKHLRDLGRLILVLRVRFGLSDAAFLALLFVLLQHMIHRRSLLGFVKHRAGRQVISVIAVGVDLLDLRRPDQFRRRPKTSHLRHRCR